MSQTDRIGKLLLRKSGATAMEIIEAGKTTCPHKRMSELKERGWTIWRKPVPGRNYGRYFGLEPGCYFEEAGRRDRKALNV